MSLFTPMKFCLISFLSIVTFPLAIVAGITTTLAFSVLVFRVSLVYVDFLLSFIPTYIFGRHTYSRRLQNVRSSPLLASHSPGSSAGTYTRRRYRRRSSASAMSVDATSPTAAAAEHHQHGLGLMSSAGMDRDFEGIGGWREGDDEVWTMINSRLEISEGGHPPAATHNHYRSLSGGRIPRTAETGLTMRSAGQSPAARRAPSVSPNMSKARIAAPGGVIPPFSSVAENPTY